MIKLGSLILIALLALASPASAGWVYYSDGSRYYQIDGDTLLFLFVAFYVVVMLGIVVRAITAPRKPPPPEKTADEYNADAVLLAARRHHTEMMTELRKVEIEAARVEAIHNERNEIVAHDKKVRDLNARLEEQRGLS